MCAGKDGRLQHADEEPDGVQLLDVCCAAGCKSGDAPQDFERREQPAGQFGTGHQEKARDLEDDIGGKVCDIEIIQFVAVETKVFLEA